MTELSLPQILQLLRRWWWILVILPIVAAGMAWFATSRMTPIYRAEATLLVERSESSGGTVSYDSLMAAERLTSTYSQLITTRSVMEQTIAQLGLSMTPEELQAKVSVQTVTETQLLRVAATDPDPALAAEIANTVAATFTAQIEAQRAAMIGSGSAELQPAIDDLRADIAETTARIAELEAAPDAESAAVQAELALLRGFLGEYQATLAGLLDSQQQMALREAESGVRVNVVDPAVAPSAPISPQPVRNIALAVVLSLALGVGVILLLGYLDDTVKTPEDVQRLTGKISIGLIPKVASTSWDDALTDSRSPAAEAFRGLRTNLQFATAGQNIKTLLITSARPGEGKSTTALQLGLVLAQAGQRVILVDADLRRPQVHRLAGLPNRAGLTNLLLAEPGAEMQPLLQWTDVPSLEILPTGPLPPNPADILNLPRMGDIIAHMESISDIVLIDTPPMAFSDALILTHYADGALVVVEAGKTRTKEVAETVHAFEQAGMPVTGTILNKVDFGRSGYRRYEYYRAYYDRDNDTPRIGEEEVARATQRRSRSWFPLRRAS